MPTLETGIKKDYKMRYLSHIAALLFLLPISYFGQNICNGNPITVSTNGYNSAPGFSQNYVLVDNSGNIIDYNTSGTFDVSTYGNSYSGNINVYAVNTDDVNLMSNASGETWANFTNSINSTCAVFIGPSNFNIISNDTTEETNNGCNNFTWTTNGQTYNSSGTYYHNLININGCDSIIQLNLTISNSNTVSTISECDEYTWNGNSYTTSGIYTNINGSCEDSLYLTINNSFDSTISMIHCDSFVWPANGVTYSSSGIYPITATNQAGCDSTINLDLTINNCDVTNLCSGDDLVQTSNGFNNSPGYSQYYILVDTSTNNIISYNSTGTFTDSDYGATNYGTHALYALNSNEANIPALLNSMNWTNLENAGNTGCTDIIGPKYYEITLCCDLSTIVTTQNETCVGLNNGEINITISGADTYNYSLDGVVQNFNPVNQGNYNIINLPPNNYLLNISDPNLNNCDTTINININPSTFPSDTTQFTQTICFGDTIQIVSGFYSANNPTGFETLSSVNGCDSVIEITINELSEIIPTTIDDTICFGDSITVNGNIYTSPNLTGTEVFMASNGCDSIVNILLTQRSQQINDINDTICFGDSIEINGTFYHGSNPTGTEILNNVYGCDSILNISIFENPIISDTIQDTICKNDTILINNNNYYFSNSSGIETFTSQNGCDSIIYVELTFDSIPNISASLKLNDSLYINLVDDIEDTVCDFDTLTFYGSGGISYLWNNDIIDSTPLLNPTEEFYSLEGIDINGCSNIFEFELFIDEYCIDFNLSISNVFTPNPLIDNDNNIFSMHGDSFEMKSMKIFNRWGQLIFEDFNGKGWDGRLQSGIEAEPGTYFYQITIQPKTRIPSDILPIQGYVKLIR